MKNQGLHSEKPHNLATSAAENHLMTLEAVAATCGVSARTVRRWIEREHLPAHHLPGLGLRGIVRITLSLLKYHRCSEGPDDRVFLSNVYRNRRGKMRVRDKKQPLPLVRREMVNGKFRHTDTVMNAFERVMRKVGIKKRGFSSLRDTGAGMIEQIDPLATEMYLAHSEPGMKRHYAQRDWARLERALIEMWDRLKDVLAVPATDGCLQPFSSPEPNGPARQPSPAAPDAPGADNYSWLA